MDNIITGDFGQQFLNGRQLITAEILYRLPDYQDLLQTYIWQHLDIAPKFPELNHFLFYWQNNIEGPLHSVTVSCKESLKPTAVTIALDEITFH